MPTAECDACPATDCNGCPALEEDIDYVPGAFIKPGADY